MKHLLHTRAYVTPRRVSDEDLANRWLLLIHQLPPKPSNLRVRVWRRLRDLGAVPIKNSVYVLPNRSESREDFEWLRRELLQDGGEASVCEARFVDGLRDDEVEALFNAARETDYRELTAAAQALLQVRSPKGKQPPATTELGADVARLRRRLDGVVARDFSGRRAARRWRDSSAASHRTSRLALSRLPSTRPTCTVGLGSPARASTSTASPPPG